MSRTDGVDYMNRFAKGRGILNYVRYRSSLHFNCCSGLTQEAGEEFLSQLILPLFIFHTFKLLLGSDGHKENDDDDDDDDDNDDDGDNDNDGDKDGVVVMIMRMIMLRRRSSSMKKMRIMMI